MQIRVGYEMVYRCPQPTPMILTLNVHYTRVRPIWCGPITWCSTRRSR